MKFEALVDTLSREAADREMFVVGVSGLGGAGKSTLCKELAQRFDQQAFHFSCDLFAKYGTAERRQRIARALDSGDPVRIEAEENPRNWYGWEAIETALEDLKRGGFHSFERGWNQQTGKMDKEAFFQLPRHAHPILLVDCIYLLHEPVRDWFDLSILVDTPLEVTAERGKTRDQHRSDPSYLAYKQNLVKQYDLPYFERYYSFADWVYKVRP